MSSLDYELSQIRQARDYTLALIDDLSPEEYFWMPEPAVSHVAWQVGHLAMVEFRLCLERLRGLQPGDREMISKDFMRTHGRGSEPVSDPAQAPSAEELRATLDRVHAAVLDEVPNYDRDDLDEPLTQTHPMFTTRRQALRFCAMHEMLHAGQIGMLRRLMGKEPLR